MFNFLLNGALAPFTIALGLLFALLFLEIVFGLIGGSLLGLGSDADFDLDGPDVDLVDLGDLDLDAMDIDAANLADIDMPNSASTIADGSAAAVATPFTWLGLGRVPMLIWIASLLTGFGLSGLFVQIGLQTTIGFMLPALLASVIAGAVGIMFARSFAEIFAKLLPKTESSAQSAKHLGNRKGIVTTGTARRGQPAEVRVQDRYNNTHYIRAEPFRDGTEIPQGTEVLVLRATYEGAYFIVAIPH